MELQRQAAIFEMIRFEMLRRVDAPMEKGSTGQGIGLTLVKSLVEMRQVKAPEVGADGPNQGTGFDPHLV